MATLSAGRDARPVGNAVYYERHRPERTLLYQIIEEYYPAFLDLMSAQCRTLLAYVQREFEDYLRCGRLEHVFLRVRCERCHAKKLVLAAELSGAILFGVSLCVYSNKSDTFRLLYDRLAKSATTIANNELILQYRDTNNNVKLGKL